MNRRKASRLIQQVRQELERDYNEAFERCIDRLYELITSDEWAILVKADTYEIPPYLEQRLKNDAKLLNISNWMAVCSKRLELLGE